MIIRPAQALKGTISVPGDKSISHRVAMIAAISHGTTRITNYSASQDCQSTLNCLRALGVNYNCVGSAVEIEGVGLDGLKPASSRLDSGNSGSTIRMLAGILAGQPFETTITGDESLRSRPMRRIAAPLEQMGASILTTDGCAPLTIRGAELKAIDYVLPVASAQVKTCTLFAGLYAEGTTSVKEPVPTRNHTELMLKEFGADVSIERDRVAVTGRPHLIGREYNVAGDISSAAFLIAAALLLPGSDLTICGVGINSTRRAIIDLLKSWGGNIEIKHERHLHGESVADLCVRSSSLQSDSYSRELSGGVIANLIDEIPVLAVLGTRVEGGLIIRNASELRVKESDRIRSIVDNLRAMGADVLEYEDGLEIADPQRLKGARIDSRHDHRIAMAFAVAGLIAEGETVIDGHECVGVSFPNFFDTLDRLRTH